MQLDNTLPPRMIAAEVSSQEDSIARIVISLFVIFNRHSLVHPPKPWRRRVRHSSWRYYFMSTLKYSQRIGCYLNEPVFENMEGKNTAFVAVKKERSGIRQGKSGIRVE
jgi:hypothetical protein